MADDAGRSVTSCVLSSVPLGLVAALTLIRPGIVLAHISPGI
jgi:hypothetical protein